MSYDVAGMMVCVTSVELVLGDITEQHVEVVVNAANFSLLAGCYRNSLLVAAAAGDTPGVEYVRFDRSSYDAFEAAAAEL